MRLTRPLASKATEKFKKGVIPAKAGTQRLPLRHVQHLVERQVTGFRLSPE